MLRSRQSSAADSLSARGMATGSFPLITTQVVKKKTTGSSPNCEIHPSRAGAVRDSRNSEGDDVVCTPQKKEAHQFAFACCPTSKRTILICPRPHTSSTRYVHILSSAAWDHVVMHYNIMAMALKKLTMMSDMLSSTYDTHVH